MNFHKALAILAMGVMGCALSPAWGQTAAKKATGGAAGAAVTGAPATAYGAAAPIKVEITSFTITPAAPQAGQTVTLKATIKNTGTGTVSKVPWSLNAVSSSGTLGAGENQNLSAGSSFDVTATWTAVAGGQTLQAYVDPTGKVMNNTAPVSSQIKQISVNVPQASAQKSGTSGQNIVEQLLNAESAKQAGAQFSTNLETPSACLIEQQTDWSGATARYLLTCPPGSGGKATPEGFANFTLKHGWTIKSIAVEFVEKPPGSEWQWSQRPNEGSNNPNFKIRLLNNLGSRITIGVKIMIKGPEGTSPYTN